MGLFSFYLGYRHAKNKAARRQSRSELWDSPESDSGDMSDEECDSCGYLGSQHDEFGNCPSY